MENGAAVRFQGELEKVPPTSPLPNRLRVSDSLTEAEGYAMLEETPRFSCLVPEAKIWRYMTMAQFCSLGLTSHLRLQSIVRYIQDDPYEGWPPPSLEKMWPPGLPYDLWPWLISSWCLSDYNNFALWYTYGDPQGVAIQTTFFQLKERLLIGERGDETGLFRIAYLNYGKEGTLSPDWLQGQWLQDERLPFLCKRRELEHEREVRLLRKMPDDIMAEWRSNWQNNPHADPPDNIISGISVRPETLVENVYPHPRSQRWVGETIKDLMKSWKWRAKFIDNRDPRRKLPPFIPLTTTPEQP